MEKKEQYKLIISVGDCEFNDEIEVEFENKEKAEEIAKLLETYGKNISFSEVIKVER